MANATSSTAVHPASAPGAVLGGIKSLKDAAYQQAKAGDTTESVARYVMSREPGFPDEVSEEGKAELVEGYRTRYGELREPQTFYRVGELLYVAEADFKGDPDKAEKVVVSVAFAHSFTTHEFGRLAESSGPQFKAIIGAVREATSTYVSNRISDLKRAVNRIKNEGKTRQRGAELTFAQYMVKVQTDSQTRCGNAAVKKDESADKAKLAKAWGAFNAIWKA